MFASAWDEGLDEAQLAAATHGDSPLVIVAGAGTGKTRTLTSRVAYLLERGVAPERVLLLTFTRRAAADMLARVAALAGNREYGRRLRGGTFHAVAHRLIAALGETLGIAPGFSVIDPADMTEVMALLRDQHGLAGRDERTPSAGALADIYSRCVNTRKPVSEVVAADFPWCEAHLEAVLEVCKAYVAHKRARNQLDFDDLLLYWRGALADERIAQELSEMFDHVLVDEYQDVNALQVDIIRRLRPDGRGLTVVGDDAQAIYAFRGAQHRYLRELVDALPSVAVIRLEQNFRSLQPILDLANAARPRVGDDDPLRVVLRATRPGGRRPRLLRCHDAGSEARAVADRILSFHEDGRRLRDQAVLVRAAHHSDLIELELTARRIPYRKYGGLRFMDSAHVKDFVALVRLVDNPADDLAWFRLFRLHEGIGPSRARALLDVVPPRRPLAEHEWAETVAAAPAASRVRLGESLQGLHAARAMPSVASRAECLLGVLRPLVATRYSDAAARLADLDRLASAASVAEDLGAFVTDLTLDPPQSSSDFAGPPHLDEDYLVVSTVHSAKGLEWPVVHLPHLVDGAFPSDMALRSSEGLAEERRLFYVALTRARDELLLYSPLRMPHHRRGRDDRHSFAPASRFLDDALHGLVEVEEDRAVSPSAFSPLGATGASAVAREVDLDAFFT